MEKLEIDLVGEIRLTGIEDGGKKKLLFNGYKGHGNIQGEIMQHSCIIYLVEKEKILAGESCNAELRFLFRDSEKFKINIKENQVFELNEVDKKVGQFIVHKIANTQIIKNCG